MTKFIGEKFHLDVAVLVHLDEVTKLKRFTGFIVNDCSGKAFVGEIGMHCSLQLPQMKRMVCFAITLRIFTLSYFDLYAKYEGGINIVVSNCGTLS